MMAVEYLFNFFKNIIYYVIFRYYNYLLGKSNT